MNRISALAFLLMAITPVLGVPLVKTLNGHLSGVQLPEAQAFFSIPYAQPPVGSLRFQNPVPIGYHGDLDVSNNTGVGCIGVRLMCNIGQCAEFETEDCLYMSIFVPNSIDLSDPTNPPKATTPVLLWFHGGAFWFGSGMGPLYDGRYIAESIGAIVITMNYRYMPFGFATVGSGPSSAPGNMGLKDQQMVMQWIQDNIAQFGGNRDEVTIWGESAGAQSVGLHLMSKVSAPLFKRGVMGSNPVSFSFKTYEEAQAMGTTLAKRAGCFTGSFECLTEKSSDEIVSAFFKVMIGNMLNGDFYGFIEPFGPIIDGVEFTEQQFDAFKNGNWNTDKSFVIGTNSQELYLVSALIPFSMSYEMFVQMNNMSWPGIADRVTNLYAPDPSVSDFRNAYGDMLSHFAFTCSSRYVARQAAKTKQSSASVYYFTNYHPLTGPDCPNMLGPLKNLCGYCYHSAELSFFWRSGPSLGHNYTPEEAVYVDGWTSYLGNFVHNGDVNKGLPDHLQGALGSFVEWPIYQSSSADGLTGPGDWVGARLVTPYPETEQEPIDQYCSFWDEIGYDFKIFGSRLADIFKATYQKSD